MKLSPPPFVFHGEGLTPTSFYSPYYTVAQPFLVSLYPPRRPSAIAWNLSKTEVLCSRFVYFFLTNIFCTVWSQFSLKVSSFSGESLLWSRVPAYFQTPPLPAVPYECCTPPNTVLLVTRAELNWILHFFFWFLFSIYCLSIIKLYVLWHIYKLHKQALSGAKDWVHKQS